MRRHLLALAALALVAALIGAWAALPLAWKHYEHHRGLEGRPMVTRTGSAPTPSPSGRA